MDQSVKSAMRGGLLTGVAFLAMAGAAYAQAQAQPQSQGIEEVTVSATRITAAGFNAPTPTTVVGSDLIQSLNQDSVFNVLTEMPSLINSSTGITGEHGTSGGNNGTDSPNLFSLGTQRSLTLIDGQRTVSALNDGTPDAQEFPHLLIERVDVVTGGASASWGSDAIAGVVNFVTNKTFEGIKAELSGGISNYDDNATGHAAFAAGTAFLGGRGHFEVSVEYDHTDGLPGGQFFGCNSSYCTQEGGRKWYHGQTSVVYGSAAVTPAGQPQVNNVNLAQDNTRAQYGLINSGPLQGIAFGANGQPYPFQYGMGPTGLQGVPAHNGSASSAGSVTNCIASFCIGGDQSNNQGGGDGLAQARTRGDVYDRFSYDLNKDTNLWLTTNFSDVETAAVSFPGQAYASLPGVPANTVGQVVQLPGIQCGNGPSAAALPAGDLPGANAYLPASINAACLANNISSFSFGSDSDEIPQNYVRTDRLTWRVAAGVDGAVNVLGSDWTYSGYYTHGQTRSNDNITPELLYPYFYAAVDSVVAQAGNAYGIPAGTTVCRNATARAEGCVPFDPFGNVTPTGAQLNWIDGGNQWSPGAYQLQHIRQDAASFSINGTPFSDWAGKVAIAAGVEYRQEGMAVTAGGAETGNLPGVNGSPAGVCNDPLLNCSLGNNWYAGNFHQSQGTMHVSEGFVEFGVPLIDTPIVGRADLDIAGRYEMYAPQGDFFTWKMGLNWDTPLPGLRLRTLMSRDVHAPTLNDLYSGANVAITNPLDPFTGQSISSHQQTEGNPLLKPERSLNTQLGLVYQPDWFPGFHVSADYYRYYIAGAISTVGYQQVINNCFAGLQQYCAGIIVNGTGTPATNPSWSLIENETLNLASLVTEGFNYEADYAFDMEDWGLPIPGSWTLRALANNVGKFTTYPNAPGQYITETAGTNGEGGVPSWQTTLYETYGFDSIGDSPIGHTMITLTERIISAGKFNGLDVACAAGTCPLSTLQNPTINPVGDHVPGMFYMNLGINHDLSDRMQAYIQIDNLMNKNPPPFYYTNYIARPTNEDLYDPIGRMFHVGIRVHM